MKGSLGRLKGGGGSQGRPKGGGGSEATKGGGEVSLRGDQRGFKKRFIREDTNKKVFLRFGTITTMKKNISEPHETQEKLSKTLFFISVNIDLPKISLNNVC